MYMRKAKYEAVKLQDSRRLCASVYGKQLSEVERTKLATDGDFFVRFVFYAWYLILLLFYVPHIGLDLSYDTCPLLFWRVLTF